ncbi:sialidase family protein [Mycolicibacterium obuense]|uniref:BNR/Asp-box repeat protein n=1 Tax=Mycolicibacterium obuense TaxID=1807 RepID=A0A0J6VH30_9MYCO|nr:exo-alpha-sialidase [Mycolicibacterium obuense]KMO69554.1 BNR/Asp-box repeat protein [Mycolicibacterium obuense]
MSTATADTTTLQPDGVLRDHAEEGRHETLLPPPRVQNHAANLTMLPDGSLACVWFSGTQEGVADISVWFSRLPAGETVWTQPVQMSDDSTRSEQNPVLHVRDGGEVWLLWTSQHAGNQDTARVQRRISNDGGNTWGPVHTMVAETPHAGVFIRQPLTVLPSGRLLLPIFYCVRTPGEKWVGNRDYSAVLISDDDGSTWREVVVPDSIGCVHMNIGRFSDGTLVALFRSRWADSIYRSVSTDDGESWSAPQPTELPNNNSSIQFVVLPDDRLALVYNHSSAADATDRRLSLYDEIDDDGLAEGAQHPVTPEPSAVDADARTAFWGAPRAPMTLAISCDGGLTWPVRRTVEDGDGYCLSNNSRDALNRELSYPSICADGQTLHVAFTRFRQAIEYVGLDNSWVYGSAT